MSETPYADKFVAFQNALDEYRDAASEFAMDCAVGRPIEKSREKERVKKVEVLRRCREMLTTVQKQTTITAFLPNRESVDKLLRGSHEQEKQH